MEVVPNAPCGVESYCGSFYYSHGQAVPNAPCGVERQEHLLSCQRQPSLEFLMHRVELKVERENFKPQPYFVVFLMHRVELKVFSIKCSTNLSLYSFLMHRVELKARNRLYR